MKRQQVRVVPWMEDSMRATTDTACLFFKAMADAGADGVYTVDSRGNSTPLATRVYISRIRAGGGREVRRLRAAPQRPGRRDRERDGRGRSGRELDRRFGDRHRRPRRLRRARGSGGAVRDVRHRDRHQAREASTTSAATCRRPTASRCRRGSRSSARTGTRKKASATWKAATTPKRRSASRRESSDASSKR